MSSLHICESSVATIDELVGMSASKGVGTLLDQPVALNLIQASDGRRVTIDIPRWHRVRKVDGRLEVRRGDGGIFFALLTGPDWDLAARELEVVSSCLRRLVRNRGGSWKARKRGTAPALR